MSHRIQGKLGMTHKQWERYLRTAQAHRSSCISNCQASTLSDQISGFTTAPKMFWRNIFVPCFSWEQTYANATRRVGWRLCPQTSAQTSGCWWCWSQCNPLAALSEARLSLPQSSAHLLAKLCSLCWSCSVPFAREKLLPPEAKRPPFVFYLIQKHKLDSWTAIHSCAAARWLRYRTHKRKS